MEETCKTAYLREFAPTHQCELLFFLDVTLDSGSLEEEVRAVRQITDTVNSLLQHVANKVRKLIKTLNEDVVEAETNIPIALTTGLKQIQIKPDLVLKKLIDSNMRHVKFQIFDQQYYIVFNAPLVKEISLPPIVYFDFMVQPNKLILLFSENNTCQYSWYKSQDKKSWIKIGTGRKYKPKEDDIGCYLKLVCVPCNSILTGPSTEVISETQVERMRVLPTYPFEDRHKFTAKLLKHKRLVSYNVLSDRYTDSVDAFPYCPKRVLAMDYRKQLISKELLGYQADIICLQEVDSLLYTSYYKDIFKKEGYLGYYHRKGNKSSEGLTCFFKKSRFQKVDDRQIIYSNEICHRSFKYLLKFVRANQDLFASFMKQMTSLHMTVLKTEISKKTFYFIVGNTHLFYHPEAELVRLVQINMATTYLNSWKSYYSKFGENTSVTVILCGDFNSVPTSAVYEYVTKGKIDKFHPILKNYRIDVDLFHNFEFESACGMPKYTNYTDDFKGCLDYIFIEKNKVKVESVVPLPTEEELSHFEGLPNDVYPSDHLAQVVDLELI